MRYDPTVYATVSEAIAWSTTGSNPTPTAVDDLNTVDVVQILLHPLKRDAFVSALAMAIRERDPSTTAMLCSDPAFMRALGTQHWLLIIGPTELIEEDECLRRCLCFAITPEGLTYVGTLSVASLAQGREDVRLGAALESATTSAMLNMLPRLQDLRAVLFMHPGTTPEIAARLQWIANQLLEIDATPVETDAQKIELGYQVVTQLGHLTTVVRQLGLSLAQAWALADERTKQRLTGHVSPFTE